jgi:hypothetical protein
MKPIYIAGLTLLILILVFALIGTVLARTNTIRVRTAPTYTRICTILVLGAMYGLTHYEWPGVHLRELDFWSLLIILAIGAYALIWAAVAYQLNKVGHPQFGDSYMLSMLYTDSQQPPMDDMVGTQPPSGKKRD